MARKVALYKIPEVLEEAEFLGDSILRKYNETIQSYNERAKETLWKFGGTNFELTSSNPFREL